MNDEDEYQDDVVKPRRGAPKGNEFWKARSKHGRDKLFASSDLLWEACCEYFQWVGDNPLWEDKAAQYQGSAVDVTVCKMRAMTIGGLCIFLDIDRSTWTEWKTAKDFSAIVAKAEAVIYEQKFTGAAADLLNPNIIARDLGLRDDSRQEITGKDGGAIEVEMSERDKARRVAFLLAKAARNKEQK